MPAPAVNAYSARWRARFGEPDASRTAADVELLLRVLPLPAFRRVLDVPCGSGRHTRALRAHGYDVVGADLDPSVHPDVVADLRDLDTLPHGFDAAITMWASFGYFDAAENERVLAGLARRLRPGGRLVLDLWNGDFFADGSAARVLAPGVVERSTVAGGRRRAQLAYDDGHVDVFEWQLFTPGELTSLAAGHGLATLEVQASPAAPSMQLVLKREAG